jgi:hypothetical protein
VSQKKIFGEVLISLSKMPTGENCGERLDFKKE